MMFVRHHALAAVAAAGLLLGGCVTVKGPSTTSYVTVAGLDRIDKSDSIKERVQTIHKLCVDAGVPEGTQRYRRCMWEYHQQDLLRLRAKAAQARGKALSDGFCVDRKTLEMSKCQAI